MKNYLLTAVAVAALGSAAPASAQVSDIVQQGIQGLLGGGGINNRIVTLESQIRVSFQRGEISQEEASRLQSELMQLRQLERSFRIDGLSRAERLELQQRVQMAEARIQEARLGRGGRFDDDRRFGRDNDGRFGRNDDDRRFGRNACPPGLAKKNNGCMPPGQAKKGDRSNGPFGDMWSDRGFQDSDRFIYRQDGNRVLQIDRRTGQVVRVIDRR